MTTSLHQIGDLAAVNSAQVRKDLALFGEFGKQGVDTHLGAEKRATAILGSRQGDEYRHFWRG